MTPLLVLLLGFCVSQDGPDPARVRELVGKLGVADIEARSAAARALEEMGEAAVPLLREAQKDAGPEARVRIDAIVEGLTLVSRWVKEIIDADPGRGYAKLRAAIQTNTLDRDHACAIVRGVFNHEDAVDQDYSYMFNLVNSVKLREFWPSLLDLSLRDDPRVSVEAATRLEALPPPKESVDRILETVPKALQGDVATKLLGAALKCGPPMDKVIPVLRQSRKNLGDEFQESVLGRISADRLRGAWPILLEWTLEGGSGASRSAYTLKKIRLPSEAITEILAALPRADSEVIQTLLEIVVAARPDPGSLDAAVRKLLEGADEEVRAAVLTRHSTYRLRVGLSTVLAGWRASGSSYRSYAHAWLLKTPPDDGVGEVIAGIESRDADEVAVCVEYASRYRLADAAKPLLRALARIEAGETQDAPAGLRYAQPWVRYPLPNRRSTREMIVEALGKMVDAEGLRRWMDDADGETPREVAVALAGELGLKESVPDILRALGDKEAKVRREAARAVGVMGLAEGEKRLEAMLADDSGGVRRTALLALVGIRGKAATKLVLAQLDAKDPDLQAAAVEVLPDLDVDAVLVHLTEGDRVDRPLVRQALAALVVRHGEAMLHRVLARTAGRLPAGDLEEMIRLLRSVPARR